MSSLVLAMRALSTPNRGEVWAWLKRDFAWVCWVGNIALDLARPRHGLEMWVNAFSLMLFVVVSLGALPYLAWQDALPWASRFMPMEVAQGLFALYWAASYYLGFLLWHDVERDNPKRST